MLIKKIRRLAKISILLVLLFCSIILYLHYLIRKPSVQEALVRRLSQFTAYDITTSKIDLNLWRGIGILVHGIEARSKSGAEGLRASKMRVVLDAGSLLHGRIVPTRIFFEQPVLDLDPTVLESTFRPEGKEGGGGRPPERKEDGEGQPLFLLSGIESVGMIDGQVRLKNAPIMLKGLALEARMKGREDGTGIDIKLRGNLAREKEEAPFQIKGNLLFNHGAPNRSTLDLSLNASRVPLLWLPWPRSVPMKGGNVQADLKLQGSLAEPLAVEGGILVNGCRFLVRDGAQEKEYSLPRVSMDFESRCDRHEVRVPSLRLSTEKVALSLALGLDLHEQEDPLIDLEVHSPFMAFATFRRYFPSPLLPAWVQSRLFPMLMEGDVSLKNLSLKGRISAFQDLHLPENHSALTIRVECKNFKVFGMGMELPFEHVSSEVLFERGDFKVSRLSAGFGQSVLRGSDLYIVGVLRENPVYEVLLDGVFDLRELMRQKNMEIVPPDIIRALERLEPISGKLQCLANFRYESGWAFPRTRTGEFVFSDVVIRQDRLRYPVSLEKAEFYVNPKEKNRFNAVGAWGNSTFHAIGIFGEAEEHFPIQWANVSADLDMGQVLPVFYPNSLIPLVFSGPLPCQVAVTRQSDRWSCQGKADLEGVTLETVGLILDPPGKQDMIAFDLDYRSDGWIDLEKMQWAFGDSSIQFSGKYHTRLREWLPLKVQAPSLSLDDLGLRARPDAAPARGLLNGSLNMNISTRDPLSTRVTGKIQGTNITLPLERIPSPINQCDFTCQFSGKKVFIPQWDLKIGESLLRIRGDLTGWDGLQGTASISSEFFHVADFLKEGAFSSSRGDRSRIKNFLDKTNIQVDVDFARGSWRKLTWGPLRADLDFRKGDIQLTRSSLRLEHGRLDVAGYLKTRSEREILLAGSVDLADQPLEGLIEGLEIPDVHMQGNLTLKGLLRVQGDTKERLIPSLTGEADILIEKGFIRKSNILLKILDFLSLQKIFKKRPADLPEKGFYFESLSGRAVTDQGLVALSDVFMESPVMDAVVSDGNVDLGQKTIDMVLGIRPLETIDFMVSKIPILGHIVTGKDKAFLTYYFKAHGPWAKPEVEYLPFKHLGSGVAGAMKRLFLTPVRLFKDLSRKEAPGTGNTPIGPGFKRP